MTYGQCIIHDFDGHPIARSNNLRGIMTRARKLYYMGETRLSAKRNPTGSGTLFCVFPDQSWVITRFASFTVLQDWIKARVTHGRGKFIIGT